MAITAAVLIRTAMQDLGVLGAGESADGTHMADGLRRLNVMLDGWSLDPLTVVRVARWVFPVVAGKGVYSIGPGLDFDVQRPVSQQSIVGAGWVTNLGQPHESEIPLAVATDNSYQGLRSKLLTNGQPSAVLYVPGAEAREPLAPIPPYGVAYSAVIVWPVPSVAGQLALYIERTIPRFENLTASYPVPDGVAAAIQHNLTVAMASMFQVEPSPFIVRQAAMTLASMKRSNYRFTDIGVDPMFTMQTPSGGYDIYSGTTRA